MRGKQNAKRMGRICCALIVVISVYAQVVILGALIALRNCCNWLRDSSSITQERWHSCTTDKNTLNSCQCITTSRTLCTTTTGKPVPDLAGLHQHTGRRSVTVKSLVMAVLVFEDGCAPCSWYSNSTTDKKASFVIPDMTEAYGHHDIHYAFVK